MPILSRGPCQVCQLCGAGVENNDESGRVVDCRWFNSTTQVDVERVQHGYDRAGNRLWRHNPVAVTNLAFLDEIYFQDGLYRLREAQRGELDPTRTSPLPATKNFAQAWGLDATGNWKNFLEDDTGVAPGRRGASFRRRAASEAPDGGSAPLPIVTQCCYDSQGRLVSMCTSVPAQRCVVTRYT